MYTINFKTHQYSIDVWYIWKSVSIYINVSAACLHLLLSHYAYIIIWYSNLLFLDQQYLLLLNKYLLFPYTFFWKIFDITVCVSLERCKKTVLFRSQRHAFTLFYNMQCRYNTRGFRVWVVLGIFEWESVMKPKNLCLSVRFHPLVPPKIVFFLRNDSRLELKKDMLIKRFRPNWTKTYFISFTPGGVN